MLGGFSVAPYIDSMGYTRVAPSPGEVCALPGTARNPFGDTLPGLDACAGGLMPAPLIDRKRSLAGLIWTRIQGRAFAIGMTFDRPMALALAERLLEPEPLGQDELHALLGHCGRRRMTSMVQFLCRIGLLEQRDGCVGLAGEPVEVELAVDLGDGWTPIAPGSSPALPTAGRLRVSVRSRLTMELRLFRVLHRLRGGTSVRSIVMQSLTRGRTAVVELDLDEVTEPGIEQLLIHVSWSAMHMGDWDLPEPAAARAPETLAERIELEREELLGTGGRGWVTEYLFPRLSGDGSSAL